MFLRCLFGVLTGFLDPLAVGADLNAHKILSVRAVGRFCPFRPMRLALAGKRGMCV